MASKSGTLYSGLTGNLQRRVYQHKNNLIEGFTKNYIRCSGCFSKRETNKKVAKEQKGKIN